MFVTCAVLYNYRQGDRSEGGDNNQKETQSHGDPCPQTQEELLQPSAFTNPEENKEEKEIEQNLDKSQLGSSVIIEVPNVQSSLELSTITGNDTDAMQFSVVKLTYFIASNIN